MDRMEKVQNAINLARNYFEKAPKAKFDVLSWDIQIGLTSTRWTMIDPREFLTVDQVGDDWPRVVPDDLSKHHIWKVSTKDVGLSPMEVEVLMVYNQPHPEAIEWLAQHSDNQDGSPRKHAHSHAIDDLLTDDELALWSKADGWHWSFKYGLAWRASDGELSKVKPNKDHRLMVLGKGLYWWIAMEWLARVDPRAAVKVLRGNFEIHHIKPYLLDKPEGNALGNLRILSAKPEHSYMNSAQRKIRDYYQKHKQ